MIRHALEQGAREMGLDISGDAIRSFELFADQLKKWNSKINLTTIINDEEIAVKHIIDALMLAGCVRDGERVLDVGSGAGVPAIPLKIVNPSVRVTSVDAVGKKILFQRHVARLLGFRDFEAIHGRVEDLGGTHAHGFDLIVSRAFSRLEQFVGLAAPLLAEAGRLIAMKGPGAADEIRADGERLATLGFEIVSVTPYRLPFNKGERNLIGIAPRKAA
jgi:16S rRNA (guanine527-N7)-methyltransferase